MEVKDAVESPAASQAGSQAANTVAAVKVVANTALAARVVAAARGNRNRPMEGAETRLQVR